MNTQKVIIKSWLYYRKSNAFIALAIAITTAVITGAFLVADSITYSLEKTVSLRLGNITHTIDGRDRYFTPSLAQRITEKSSFPASAMLQTEASVQADPGRLSLPKIQLLGVDTLFRKINPSLPEIHPGEVTISENLAHRLNVQPGDYLLFHINRATIISLNTPFVSTENQDIAKRLKINRIIGNNQMGRFSLLNVQSAPFNAFVSLPWLNTLMELEGKANRILLSVNDSRAISTLTQTLEAVWCPEDLSLKTEPLNTEYGWQISSERVFFDQAHAQLVQ
ncbi:MAG: hypothetical protein PHU97_00325 [Bacteroidales bacterium]|nr:hypothetical protein [Bacteroidales bacterium]MDD3960605.1 hypothetical protein [Bacteroidales bacterium]HPE86845.1 hypothetical protein [Bacteroidales bacterium]